MRLTTLRAAIDNKDIFLNIYKKILNIIFVKYTPRTENFSTPSLIFWPFVFFFTTFSDLLPIRSPIRNIRKNSYVRCLLTVRVQWPHALRSTVGGKFVDQEDIFYYVQKIQKIILKKYGPRPKKVLAPSGFFFLFFIRSSEIAGTRWSLALLDSLHISGLLWKIL